MANEKESKSIFFFISNMYREYGFMGFYRGLDSNIMRASVLNATKVFRFIKIINY